MSVFTEVMAAGIIVPNRRRCVSLIWKPSAAHSTANQATFSNMSRRTSRKRLRGYVLTGLLLFGGTAPCVVSVCRVRVSRQCIASVCRVRANIRDFKSVSFTPQPSDFDGLETAPSAPSGVNVARGVARDVSRGVSRDVSRGVYRNVARGVGRMRQYDHLTGAGSPPFFTSVITCP